MDIIYFVCIFLVVIVTRLLPRIIFPNILSFRDDTWHIFVAAQAIRKNNHRIPLKINNYLLEDKHDYPPLIPWLFSFLSDRNMERLEIVYPTIIDFLYAISFWMFAQYFLPHIIDINEYTIFLCTIYFITYPIYFHIGKGSRTYKTTPRIFSELLVAGYAFCFSIFFITNNLIWIILLFILGILQALTNRFGLQVILIFTIFSSVILNQYYMGLIPFIILAIMFIPFGQLWMRNLSGFIGHAIFMRKNWYNPNRNVDLIQKRHSSFKMKLGKFPSLLYSIIMEKKVLSAFIYSPIIYVGVVFFLYSAISGNFIFVDQKLYFCIIWVAASIFAGFLFSTKELMFWGTGDRYLAYSVPFQVIILFYLFVHFGIQTPTILCLLVFNIIPLIIHLIILYRTNSGNNKTMRHEEELYNFISRLNITPKILPVLGGKAHKIIYKTGCNILDVEYSYRPWIYSEKIVKTLFSGYCYPNPANIQYMIETYNLNLIVCYRKALETAKNNDITYDFSNYKSVLENDMFIVFDCNN